MNETADVIVSCQNAAFGYDGRSVVRHIAFDVRRGDYLCIVGENGSGKSTVLKGVLRLIHPLEGRLHFSRDIQTSGIGYVAQSEAAKKDFPAGVFEIVLSGFAGRMGLRPFYSRREKSDARENMRRLDVAHLYDSCFRELSGGQQRRVLIARALCASSSLLALDEPAAGLDPLATAGLYELLAKLNQSGITVISVTHDVQSGLRFASHVLHIKDGLGLFAERSVWAQSETARAFSNNAPRGGSANDR